MPRRPRRDPDERPDGLERGIVETPFERSLREIIEANERIGPPPMTSDTTVSYPLWQSPPVLPIEPRWFTIDDFYRAAAIGANGPNTAADGPTHHFTLNPRSSTMPNTLTMPVVMSQDVHSRPYQLEILRRMAAPDFQPSWLVHSRIAGTVPSVDLHLGTPTVRYAAVHFLRQHLDGYIAELDNAAYSARTGDLVRGTPADGVDGHGDLIPARFQAVYWLFVYGALYESGDATAFSRNRNTIYADTVARHRYLMPVEDRLAQDAADGLFDNPDSSSIAASGIGWLVSPSVENARELNDNALFWFNVLATDRTRFLRATPSALEREWRHAPRRMATERCDYSRNPSSSMPRMCFRRGATVRVGGTRDEPIERFLCSTHVGTIQTAYPENDPRHLWAIDALFGYYDSDDARQWRAPICDARDPDEPNDEEVEDAFTYTARCGDCNQLYVFDDDAQQRSRSRGGTLTGRCLNCGYRPRVGEVQGYHAPAPSQYLAAAHERVSTPRLGDRLVHTDSLMTGGVLLRPPTLFGGIELEMEFMGALDWEVTLQEQAVAGEFIYKHDGSLHNGCELVTAPATFAWWKENQEDWTERLNAFRHAGFRSFDPGTCGMHIHVSRAALTPTAIYALQCFAYGNPDFMQILAQRGENRYATYRSDDAKSLKCRIGKARLARPNQLYGARYSDRYEAINVPDSHPTVEFRMFRGTLNPASFFKNIEVAFSLCHFVLSAGMKDAKSVASYLAFVERRASDYPHLVAFIKRHTISIRAAEHARTQPGALRLAADPATGLQIVVTDPAKPRPHLPLVDEPLVAANAPQQKKKKQRPTKLAPKYEFADTKC